MKGRRWGLALAMGVVVLGLAVWRTREAPAPADTRPVPPRGEVSGHAVRPTEPDHPDAPAAVRAPVEPPAERGNALPRLPPQFFDAGLKPVAQRGPRLGPIDRRENPGPRAQQEMEMVRYAFQTMDEDIQACLEQWEKVEPGQATEVMIGFEIDANGLQRSWLDHDGGVPFGPRTCLANAVYGIDWSHIVDHPAMLTNRFQLGRDAG